MNSRKNPLYNASGYKDTTAFLAIKDADSEKERCDRQAEKLIKAVKLISDGWWDAAGPAGYDSPIVEVVWVNNYSGFFPFANYDCDCGVYTEPENCKVLYNIHDKEE